MAARTCGDVRVRVLVQVAYRGFPGRLVDGHVVPAILGGVLDSADWTLITWTPLWSSLMGDPAQIRTDRRNLVLDTFLPEPTPGRPPVRSEGGQDACEAALVADLRVAHGTFPDDPRLRGLVHECTTRSTRFAQLGSLTRASAPVSRHFRGGPGQGVRRYSASFPRRRAALSRS
ncbi:hypothetical protein [Streptomyces sp. AK02-01A]|uniref:MmyB family transcriptional regulator n=1 Tax=Streptomyces sp. AK02-01A TaxID=3028648 RepID=UPI0029A8676D|nr:hypothetical protein [Streptomyces sp. AK02-01A]MDX3850245.1 hypothetical protein [Streptomyces sp. AK02-01A]